VAGTGSPPLCQPRREQFVRQDALVLRIVQELDHIEMAIRTAHHVALRATPHPPNVLNRFDRQRASRQLRVWERKI